MEIFHLGKVEAKQHCNTAKNTSRQAIHKRTKFLTI